MWSVYLDTNPVRLVGTRAFGSVSRRAYYGPVAPLRARQIGKVNLPGRRWVRVRNAIAGISGRDLAIVHLDADPRISLLAAPRRSRIYLGHEVVGEVTDVGPDVEFLRVGDRVAYQLDQCCATLDIEPPCRHCAVGNYSLCESRYLAKKQSIGGGWGDEMVLHERQLFLVPDNLSDEQATLLEPTAVALHAVLRRPPQPGESVLVIGAGSQGLLTTQAVRLLAPNANIAVLARYPFQVEMATRMGASNILYPQDGYAGVARLTGARHFHRRFGADLIVGGFDVVYDAVGSATTIQQALGWTRAGGAVVLVGSQMLPLNLDLTPIWHQEVTLIGATGHGAETWPGGPALSTWSGDNGGRVSTFALAATLVRDHRMTPQRLITHRFPLREVRLALATAYHRSEHHSIKVMLDIRDVASSRITSAPPVAQEVTG